MAAAIKRELGVETTLIKGKDGVFDVKAGGELLFSKHDAGRFPTEAEVLGPLGKKLGVAKK